MALEGGEGEGGGGQGSPPRKYVSGYAQLADMRLPIKEEEERERERESLLIPWWGTDQRDFLYS